MWLRGEVEESFCHLFVFVSGVAGWCLKESQDLYHHCDCIIIIVNAYNNHYINLKPLSPSCSTCRYWARMSSVLL